MIPFLEVADQSAPCLIDDQSSKWTSYGELNDRAMEWRQRLDSTKSVVFLYAENDRETVAALLGALAAQHAVALLDPRLPSASKEALARAYSPEFVIDRSTEDNLAVGPGSPVAPSPELALLLSTSGSTGSPKFVRLTRANLTSNAKAISTVLSIGPDSVACGHLPLHYSFGLSVLTSHLATGARIVLTNKGFMDRDFWKLIKAGQVTHLPGVPFHFSILEKLGYARLDLPQLQCLAQAGGHLDIASRGKAHSYMEGRGGRFYVMYGQTEASPRMTTLQHEEFPLAPASVGTALPGGAIEIDDPDEQGRGEVVYSGPNVMMGYADGRSDLAKGDELRSVLRTGDLGFLDEARRLILTGRAKRSAKLFGLRVNLDEIEKLTNTLCPSAVTESATGLRIFYESRSGISADELKALLTSRYALPVASYAFTAVDHVPRTARGKINYESLEALK